MQELSARPSPPTGNQASRPVAWITGGTRGLGLAVSQKLMDKYALALSYHMDDKRAAATAQTILDRSGMEPLLLRGDLSRDGIAAQQAQAIRERFGRLDALVHCVALATFKPLLELQPRELRRTLGYSFEALHHVVLASVEMLAAQKGNIAVVSSLGARRALPGYAALGSAKAALESYSRHLASELGQQWVRVNVVSPGVIKTESLQWVGIDAPVLETVRARTPLRRLVETQEVAEVIAFLISASASAVTGQTISVDGGYEIVS